MLSTKLRLFPDHRGGADGGEDTDRFHLPHRHLDCGESVVEHVAGVEDYQVALATYRAACEPPYRTRSPHPPLRKATIGDPPVQIDRCCRNSRAGGGRLNLAGTFGWSGNGHG